MCMSVCDELKLNLFLEGRGLGLRELPLRDCEDDDDVYDLEREVERDEMEREREDKGEPETDGDAGCPRPGFAIGISWKSDESLKHEKPFREKP